MPLNYFEKAKKLPSDLRQFSLSDEPRILAEEACLLYSISEEKMSAVTLPLGDVFVGELPLSQYPVLIQQGLGVDEAKAYGIAFEVNKRIFLSFPNYFKDAASLQEIWKGKKSEPMVSLEAARKQLYEEIEVGRLEKQDVQIEDKPAPSLHLTHAHKLPLLKAMAEYERLGEQPITNEKIKVKGQPEPQRPSLANWIRYYRDELGIGFHDQVSRGRFLFQSENGKRLSNEERERINLVLKSIEEDFPLDIDTEHQTIIFPVRTQAPSPQAPSSRPLFSSREAVPTRPVKPYEPQRSSIGSQSPATEQAAPMTRPQPLSGGPQGVPAPVVPPGAKPSFLATKLSPAKNVAGETLHFSTGHVLPGEQAKSVPSEQPPTASTPPTAPVRPTQTPSFHPRSLNQNRGVSLPRSPYSIRPLRMRSNEGGEQGENA